MAEYTVVAKEKEYVPEWDGNREKPEPIRVTLGYLTAAQRSQCISGRKVGEDQRIELDYAKALRYGLRRIDNLIVNKKPMTTAQELLDSSGFDGLFLEVAMEIWGMNAREDARPLP